MAKLPERLRTAFTLQEASGPFQKSQPPKVRATHPQSLSRPEQKLERETKDQPQASVSSCIPFVPSESWQHKILPGAVVVTSPASLHALDALSILALKTLSNHHITHPPLAPQFEARRWSAKPKDHAPAGVVLRPRHPAYLPPPTRSPHHRQTVIHPLNNHVFNKKILIVDGCLLAFGAAFANTGLVLRTGTSVSHLTGDIARFNIGIGQWSQAAFDEVLFVSSATIGFLLGATLAGFIVHHPTINISRPRSREMDSRFSPERESPSATASQAPSATLSIATRQARDTNHGADFQYRETSQPGRFSNEKTDRKGIENNELPL